MRLHDFRARKPSAAHPDVVLLAPLDLQSVVREPGFVLSYFWPCAILFT